MLRTGLTGGTGSGKSTVAHRLGERGAFVVDADVLAREVVAPGSEGLAAVVQEFGPEVLAPDGALDRTALAAVVFGDDGRRRALEAITHPLIAHRTGELVAAAPDDAVLVHDVPLLVEKRMGAGYHLVVVVDAPVEDRVRRLVGRGMPETTRGAGSPARPTTSSAARPRTSGSRTPARRSSSSGPSTGSGTSGWCRSATCSCPVGPPRGGRVAVGPQATPPATGGCSSASGRRSATGCSTPGRPTTAAGTWRSC